MFEARIKVLLVLLAVATSIIVARLVDMQVIHADIYREQAEQALILNAKVLGCVRGSIRDRQDNELVSDQPCWDVCVDYGILDMDEAYLTSLTNHLRSKNRYGEKLETEEVSRFLERDIKRMWSDLSSFGGIPLTQLREDAKDITDRIHIIKEQVSENRGFPTEIREERMRHAILTGLDDQLQVQARRVFGDYPWVRVESSTKRTFTADDSYAHVLGQLGAVTAERLREDPFEGDELREYLGSEKLGVAGVEQTAERLLRGRRGRFQQTREDVVIESIPPQRGQDVHLTIRSDLQQRIYAMFGREIAQYGTPPGGAIVILDIPTREVLALVSYPGYDPSRFRQDYKRLRRDTKHQPLSFRAVANSYAPGSIVKPLTVLAGLGSGKISTGTTFNCQGALFPEHPDRWRCWLAAGSGHRMRHGAITGEEAIKHSCNIFMYHTGQIVGVDYLTGYFDMFGFGKRSGTGLLVEAKGTNPTPDWLARNRERSVSVGDARNFAIGGGEVSVTPVQAANLMACYASGEYKRVTLIREMASNETWTLPGEPSHWDAIRRGLYRVVNDLGGTAHKTTCLTSSDKYVICGKTGSASVTYGWPTSYRVPYVDTNGAELTAIMPAASKKWAVNDFRKEYPNCKFDPDDVKVHERWPNRPPASGDKYSHAWFGAYLQEKNSSGQPLWDRQPRIAYSVLVEFGGSGGRVSGPIAKKVAEIIIDTLGPDLDPDYVPLPSQDETGGEQ